MRRLLRRRSDHGRAERPPSPRDPPPPPSSRASQPAPDHAEESLADVVDDAVPSRSYEMLPMVGLGGSAGSIAGAAGLLRRDAGRQRHGVRRHPAPVARAREHAGRDPAARDARCRCSRCRTATQVEANHVYVIPPGKTLAVGERPPDAAPICRRERGRRVAVDLFFRTLADTHGPHAAAIVLSGADGDGAIGIKRIKERGGLTIAQDPDEAEHAGMPRSAIATGMVDWVLPVAEMPARLLRLHARPAAACKLPPEDGPQPAQPPAMPRRRAEATLREVLAFLRARTGRDFCYYKRATILRRIARRMQVNGVDDLPAYLDFLRTHPGEAGALLQDLLISVTNFFRDRDAFDALEAQIPALFAGKGRGDDGARLGAGVRHRRGGVLDRHAAGRARARCSRRRRRSRSSRPTSTRTRSAPPARRLPGGDRRRRLRGAAAPLLHQGARAATASAASCARWCSSPPTTC